MRYQRIFPHPKRKKEYVIVTWYRGYDRTEVVYQGVLLSTIDDPRELIKGKEILVDGMGKLEIRLYEDPYDLHVFFNDLHSPANTNHPKLNIGSVSINFLLPLVINLIIFTRLYSFHILDKKGSQVFDGPMFYFLLTILGVTAIGLLTGIILLFNRKIVGFLIAGAFFYVEAFLFVISSTFLDWGESTYVLWGIEIIHMLLIPFAFLKIMEYKRHLKERGNPTEELLDDPIDQ